MVSLVTLSVYLFLSRSVGRSVCMYVCMHVRKEACMSVDLHTHMYIYIWYPPPQLSTVFVGSLEPTRENPPYFRV